MIDDSHFIHWKPDIFASIFQPSLHKITPLPDQIEASRIVLEYFNGFNQAVPIWHQATFMSLFEAHDHNGYQRQDSGWWASLNIILALGHRILSMRTSNSIEEDPKAWMYLHNAVAVLPELILRNKDLLSVQALLGIAVFLQGTSSPHPAFSLVATTIRQAHSLELHRESPHFDEEAEQRLRVFWTGYFLDKDISLRTGQPPVQDDLNMDVRLPSPYPIDDAGTLALTDGSTVINIFRLRVELSIIQSRIYQDLYSVRGLKRSDAEKESFVAQLDADLQQWKLSVPYKFWPENMHTQLSLPSVLHMAILYSTFFNTLVMLHCKAPGYGLNISCMTSFTGSSRPLSTSEDASLSAARSILRLMHLFPRGDYACIWYVSHLAW